MERANIFWSGRSQEVRLPKDLASREKKCAFAAVGSAVMLEAVAEDWAWLDAIAGKLDEDFVDAALEDVEQQKRPALENQFR